MITRQVCVCGGLARTRQFFVYVDLLTNHKENNTHYATSKHTKESLVNSQSTVRTMKST